MFKMLNYLYKIDLYYKLFKCRFKVDKIDFLKYIISYNILYLDPNRVRVILK